MRDSYIFALYSHIFVAHIMKCEGGRCEGSQAKPEGQVKRYECETVRQAMKDIEKDINPHEVYHIKASTCKLTSGRGRDSNNSRTIHCFEQRRCLAGVEEKEEILVPSLCKHVFNCTRHIL